jgi:hypothetical protein
MSSAGLREGCNLRLLTSYDDKLLYTEGLPYAWVEIRELFGLGRMHVIMVKYISQAYVDATSTRSQQRRSCSSSISLLGHLNRSLHYFHYYLSLVYLGL